MRLSLVLLALAPAMVACSDSTAPQQTALAVTYSTARTDTTTQPFDFSTRGQLLNATGKWVEGGDCPIILSFTGYRDGSTLVLQLHVTPSPIETLCTPQPVGYSWDVTATSIPPGNYTVQVQYPNDSGGFDTVASAPVMVRWTTQPAPGT